MDPEDRDLLVAAAWLHDIGYAPPIGHLRFHPVDGARFLEAQEAPERLCALVAHHSCARYEAEERGLTAELAGDIDNEDPEPSRRGFAGAALRTALDLHPCRPDSRWMTSGEQAAFQAGQVEALASVRRAILHALGVPPIS